MLDTCGLCGVMGVNRSALRRDSLLHVRPRRRKGKAPTVCHKPPSRGREKRLQHYVLIPIFLLDEKFALVTVSCKNIPCGHTSFYAMAAKEVSRLGRGWPSPQPSGL